jgi:hypothetical protein
MDGLLIPLSMRDFGISSLKKEFSDCFWATKILTHSLNFSPSPSQPIKTEACSFASLNQFIKGS